MLRILTICAYSSFLLVWLSVIPVSATRLGALTSSTGLRLLGAQDVDAVPEPGGVTMNAFMLPLEGRHGTLVHGRKLLRAASMGVDGSVREVGYFYATVGLGSPSRKFQLIIDTGSTITYVPCANCKHCGKHRDEPFDPSKSSTAQMLGCGTPKCNCGSPSCQCMQDKCYYSRTYAERSSSDGFLLEDVLAFSDVPGSVPVNSTATAADVRIVFGCEDNETGEIYRQKADGIMGLGNNNNALQSQLVEQKVIADTFSLCFGYPNGGLLLMGDVSLSKADQVVYTPFKPSWQTHYYTVTINHMRVGSQLVDVPARVYATGYGAVLDSGTTFTYLPSDAFKAFSELVKKAATAKGLQQTPGPDANFNDICWKEGPKDPAELSKYFPDAEMAFAGDAVLPLRPLQYLFVLGEGTYCLGVFDNQAQGTLLGGITVRNVLVQYDRRNRRAGFLPLSSCGEVASLIRTPYNHTQSQAIATPDANTTIAAPIAKVDEAGDTVSKDPKQPVSNATQAANGTNQADSRAKEADQGSKPDGVDQSGASNVTSGSELKPVITNQGKGNSSQPGDASKLPGTVVGTPDNDDDTMNSDDDDDNDDDSDSIGRQGGDQDSKANDSTSDGDDNGDDYEGDQLEDYENEGTTDESKTGASSGSDPAKPIQNDKQAGSSDSKEHVYVSQMHSLHGWAALGPYGPVLLLVGLVIVVGAGFAWSYRLKIIRGWQQWQTVAQSDEFDSLRTNSVSDLLKQKPSVAQQVISVKAGPPS